MKVLVPLDGSEVAECVLPVLEVWAKKLDLEITLFSAITYPGPDWPGGRDVTTLEEGEMSKYLKSKHAELTAKGFKVATAMREGNPPQAILDVATEGDYDLIAMSTHGRSGVARWVMGSVTDKVLTASPIPVLVVRGKEAQRQLGRG